MKEIREPLIQVQNLTVRYGEREILSQIDLTVNAGEILAVVGPSGCGKSTLLRHMVGLERPAAGRVYVRGIEVGEMDEEKYRNFARNIGMLYQAGALFNSLSLGENIAFPLREHTDLGEEIIFMMVRLKLGLVGLAGYEKFFPSELSGGMRKRAALARALALDPEIIFFDEPTSGLDPILAGEMDTLIRGLKNLLNITAVMVTHEMASVFAVADRIVMLDQGRIIAEGTSEDIRKSREGKVHRFLYRLGREEEQDKPSWFSGILDEKDEGQEPCRLM